MHHFQIVKFYRKFSISKRVYGENGESRSPTPETLWHLTDADSDPARYTLIMLHPTELARQITLLTHDFIRETGLDELNNNKSSRNRQLTNFFVNRSVFYLRGVLVLTKSLKERQALLERIMEMVVVFELHNNFLWVQMLVNDVIYWEGIDRLELTRKAAFANRELKKL